MLKIVCVGKIKEKYLIDAFSEYEKRISAFQKLKVVELKESNNKDLKHNIEEEGHLILNAISQDEYVITLEILGEMLDSVELSNKIDGLIHISQISKDHVEKVKDVLTVGGEVEARVIKVDTEERRIGLSIKAVSEDFSEADLKAAEEEYTAALKPGEDMVNVGEVFADLDKLN
jgi:rRNA large subunit m3Psi methyltransferase RlmH